MKKTLIISAFLSGLSLLPATSQAQTGGGIFTAGPAMNRQRIDPIMTTLDDGRIATFGGREFNFVSCSYADLYNPSTNTFTEISMLHPHDMASVVKLGNGKYFIIGGSMDLGVAPGYATTEIFDPATNTFTDAGTMDYSRCWVSAALMANGKVLIAGAWYNTSGATYGDVYDASANIFTATNAMNEPRANPLILPTNDTGAMVLGGWDTYGSMNFTSVEYYSYADNSFHSISSDIIPTDPGWLVSGAPFQRSPSADYRMTNGKYLVLASRTESYTEFALLTFDPATKVFSKITTSTPIKDTCTDGGFYDVVLDKATNYAYLLGVDSGSDPLKISLTMVDLSSGMVYHPGSTFTMPEAEYLFPNMAFIPSNGNILLEGVSSTSSDYYHATNKTYIITPAISQGVKDLSADLVSISLYPDPATDALNLRFEKNAPENVGVKIYDVAGRVLIATDIRVPAGVISVPIGQLCAGMYICEVSSNGQVTRNKFLKK